jgi:hypothetical protein
VQIIMSHDSLCAQGEGGGGYGGGEAEPLDDLLPLLLVDDLHEAAPRHHQVVQLVQVQHLLSHDRQPVDRGAALLHESKELVQEFFALRVVVYLVQLQRRTMISLIIKTMKKLRKDERKRPRKFSKLSPTSLKLLSRWRQRTKVHERFAIDKCPFCH